MYRVRVGSKSQSWGGKKTSELGAWSESFGELGEVFGESHWRVGRLGGAQRSLEVPCMVHFRHQTGAKTGAGQRTYQLVDRLGHQPDSHAWDVK